MNAPRSKAPRSSAASKLDHRRTDVRFDGTALRIVAVADTHGRPHPDLHARIRELSPAHIVHAGDVGELTVLRDLERIAPLTAVRGNIDPHGPADLPDRATIDVRRGDGCLVRIFMTHIAVYGPKLRADVARVAREEDASLVVCGHSHVPFATHDRGIAVFNPGSAGPRRFQLPIVFGVIDVSPTAVTVRHVDCETGRPWTP
jgi:putative phosphoesterase